MTRGLARGARAAALVTQMAVVTALGGFLGNLADSHFQTQPLLISAGFISGFAIGTFAMLKGLLQTPDDDTTPHPPQ